MLWPGLNTRPEGKMAQRGEEQQKEYLQHREEVIAKRKRLGIESTRGWSGARWGGVHLDPPEPVPGQDFSDFKCVLMEVRRVSHRNSKIGRVYGIRAMVAVGNGKGIVGIGGCVASDLVSAVRKARLKAFNRLQYIERYVSCLINSGMGNLFTIAGRKLWNIASGLQKLINFILKFYLGRREKATSRIEKYFSWFTVRVAACHGVPFWRDVVF